MGGIYSPVPILMLIGVNELELRWHELGDPRSRLKLQRSVRAPQDQSQ
jgi:hypothetical protein